MSIERAETAAERRVSELRAEIARNRAETLDLGFAIDAVMHESPDGIAVATPDGALQLNPVGREILGALAPNEGTAAWVEQYGLFRSDRTSRWEPDELPLVRAMKGETIADAQIWMRSAARLEGCWLSVSARPIGNGSAIAVFRDTTIAVELRRDLEDRNAALAVEDATNRDLIERLRVSLDELSTPVLEVWEDVLALPVIGLVDTQRSAQMTERVLEEVARTGCRYLIIDLTGVEIVDTSTADRFLKVARSVRLLGAECIVTGIQPAVAQTLVEIGVDLDDLETHRDLARALDACRRALAARKVDALAAKAVG